MFDKKPYSYAFLAMLILAFAASAATQAPVKNFKSKEAKATVGASPAVIWREPAAIQSRDLFYGPGGPDHQPHGKLSFIQEKFNGVNPKFDVRDEDGIRWGVKLGNEAKPEVAATRLVWAVGYFTNEDYYLPELKVGGLQLKRGQELIDHSKINGVRLKRHNKGEHQIANWGWDKNPFVGSKELDGLKVMMEVICNVDLKSLNQHVYDENAEEQRYIAADLGSSFGMCGKTIFYTKGKLKDFQSKPLIQNAGPEYVDFWRFKHVPREHAKWIGGYLAQLSDTQISDAFRAAGFTPQEIEGYTKKVREKINELNQL
jgi:hypothetical protein